MVYALSNICSGEWHAQTPLGFQHTNGSSNLSQTTSPHDNNQKEENLQNCRLCCSGCKIERKWKER